MTKKHLRVLILILTILNILFIFTNSLMNSTTSSNSSTGIREMVNNILKKLHIPFSFTEHFVRKAAHFTEFLTLGILMTLCIYLCNRQNIFIPLFAGLLTAVTDEFIQLFADGRAGQVADVVLDFSGFVTGVFFITLMIFIYRRKKIKKESDTVQCTTIQ